MIGKLARSKSGHDKDKVYVIIRMEDGFVWLADGETRTLARPKKKNLKHTQPILHLPEAVEEELAQSPQTDLLIKRAVKLYEQDIRRELHVKS